MRCRQKRQTRAWLVAWHRPPLGRLAVVVEARTAGAAAARGRRKLIAENDECRAQPHRLATARAHVSLLPGRGFA